MKGRTEKGDDADCAVSGKGHLREALLLHEEALRVNRLTNYVNVELMTRVMIERKTVFNSFSSPDQNLLILILTRMCRELRKKDILSEVLRLSHDRSLNKYADVDDEDDFQVFSFILLKVVKYMSQEVVEPPPIMPATTYQLTLAFPDFSQYKVII